MSAVGSVHGEALDPPMRVIPDTANRPLRTCEVAVLKARGLHTQALKLTAVVNRAFVLPI